MLQSTLLEKCSGLRDDQIAVWSIQLDMATFAHPAPEILSKVEMARAHRFRTPRLRDRFISGRAAVRTILACYLSEDPGRLVIETSPYGKPHLEDNASLQFNLSHSGEVALLAVASGRALGIDLEELRPMGDMEGIVARFFSTAERVAFLRAPVDTRLNLFFRTWTRKEAYSKGLGVGLSASLEGLDVGAGTTPLRLPGGWRLIDLDCEPCHCAALAAEGDAWSIRRLEF
jgi:4'-phosphopantetheinyl transferase